jgi:glycosyltransferase involved in cell wall biosynthesis
MEGLRAIGVEVVEQHSPVWRGTEAKVAAIAGGTQLILAGLRQAAAWRRLGLAAAGPADAVLVGATAHADLPLARVVARRLGVPLFFDPLVSATETARDRGLLGSDSTRLRALRTAEKWLFRLADRVVVDTFEHGRAFAAELGLPLGRAVVVPAGAPAVYATAPPLRTVPGRPVITVAYFGQYIPLHGVEVVLEAADRLREDGRVRFRLAGIGQALAPALRTAERLRLENVEFDARWMPAGELVETHVAPADICLGIFGDVPKARHVVPFKLYAGLAAGRPVISGDTPALRELLATGREVVAVRTGSGAALAAAIGRFVEEPGLRLQVGEAGNAAYHRAFAPARLAERLRSAIEAVVAERAERALLAGGGRRRAVPSKPGPA